MNDKMTFHRIAASIAAATGCTDEEAALFLRTLLDKATEALARGERVTIKGIGTFAPGEPSQEAVLWAPDRDLADAVNEPFAAFEPVALAPGVTEAELSEQPTDHSEHSEISDSSENSENSEAPVDSDTPETAVPTAAEVIAEADEIVDSAPEIVAGGDAQPVPEEVAAPEKVAVTEDDTPAAPVLPSIDSPRPEEAVRRVSLTEAFKAAEAADSEKTSDDEPQVAVESPREEPTVIYRERSGLNPWLMLLVGVLVGLAMGYFIGMSFGYLSSDTAAYEEVVEDEEIVEETPSESLLGDDAPAGVETDASAAVEPEQAAPASAPVAETPVAPAPAPKVVTDTVTGHRYLTTMARKYYGNNCFWVYIYEENAAKISNPDRIRPGTVVVIPPASKYGIDASDPASVRRATAKIGEIERSMKGKR